MKRLLTVLIAMSSTLAACATVSAPTRNPAQTTSAPAATATTAAASQSPAPAANIVMCTLMPLADVQAKSPFQTALATATPDVVPAGCTYTAAIDAEEPVSVGLVVTTFDSPADAITVLHNDRQTIVDRGLPVSDIAGLGDEAFSYGSDEVGVRAVVGALYVEAHLKGEWPDTTDDAKVAAGTELVRTIISRLP
jgi:hypothetical protein